MNPILVLVKAAAEAVTRGGQRVALAYLESAILIMEKAEAQRAEAPLPKELRDLIAAGPPRPKEKRQLVPIPAPPPLPVPVAVAPPPEPAPAAPPPLDELIRQPHGNAGDEEAAENKRDGAVTMDDRRDPLAPPDKDEILF